MQTGGEVTPVLAEFHTLLAGQSVPEWRAVLDALQELDHVGAGPVGYCGMSLGCGTRCSVHRRRAPRPRGGP